MPLKIDINKEKLAEFCRKHHIRKLWLFGSALRDDFRDDSDVDVLIEFEPGSSIGLLGLSEIQWELSELFGLPVDARTLPELSHYFRERIAQEALEFYVA